MFPFLNLFCALSFVGYGLSCLTTERMAREFERYGLTKFRVTTGVLQLLGAAGLLIGFLVPLAGALASGGLATQMLLGFGVRLKIRDRFIQYLPALAYLVISAWLFTQFLR